MKLSDSKQLLARLQQGLVTCICASVATAGLFAGSASAADCQGQLTKLSECTPNPQGEVVVGGNGCKSTSVYIDQSLDLGRLTIDTGGELCVRDADMANVQGRSLRLRVSDITVKGALQIGSKDAPIGRGNPANHVYIGFRGEAPATAHDAAHASMQADQPCPDPDFRKGLQLCQGGVLRLFGDRGAAAADSERHDSAGKVSWSYLSQPAGDPCRFGPDSGAGSPVTNEGCSVWPGGRTLNLADAVDWQVDDWIVVGTTSFSPFETEFAKIKQIDATRKVLIVEYPLVYYHFGGADPGVPSPGNYRAGRDKNWGVDERAEVGLISRNITLSGQLSGAPQDHWGGETIVRVGFKEASVQGVEFSFMGKPKLGSYPVHFHMIGRIGQNQTALFNANTIHHSYNKCITVHSTQNLVIQNNVCARAVGHLFYQEVGDEDDITFKYNLGLGAMSHNFDIHMQKEFSFGDKGEFLPVPKPHDLRERHWWPGDNLGREYGSGENYFALNVPNHDNQLNPTHGSCRDPLPDGRLGGAREPTKDTPCKPSSYFEPASGFWIINPGTKLIGNSIGGCQGVGRAYWYVPPKTAGSSGKPDLANLKFKPVGEFRNNRAHSCYAGLYAEPENDVYSDQLLPHKGGELEGESVFNVVDGLTVTRMRDRGIWLRPSFWVVKNARLATNRDSVSLVTAGGVDGTAPGNWALLEDSVLLGISLNNVDRFGPCPYRGINGPQSGGEGGCIDRTPYDRGKVVDGSGGDDIGRGYPDPSRNFFGIMVYDGPGRYFRNRFVNFNSDISPYLTAADQAALGWYKANFANPLAPPDQNQAGTFVYEGDAALGWFNANQSSYPNTQASEGLEFENVDLRHQIYTDRVGIDTFNDGDKNTLILDRDGSLTGMKVVGPDKKQPVGNVFPASLNNLPFNASSNSVDECLATGAQNALLENRPTSLISPSAMATLEFSALFPQALQPKDGDKETWRYEQVLGFAKTTPDVYPNPVGQLLDQMTLHGRNGLGVWEPKVSNGYGYTLRAIDKYSAPGSIPAPAGKDVGIPPSFNLGLTDAILASDPTTHKVDPFHVRLAICFTSKGKHPQPKSGSDFKKMFKITRGYKGYGSPTSNGKTLEAKNLWHEIKACNNLDAQNKDNLTGCPAKGVVVDSKCPDGQAPQNGACPTKEITPAADGGSWGGNQDTWYYDQTTGYLYLHVVQGVDNAYGPSPPSPTGSCDLPKGAQVPPECPNAEKKPPWSLHPENYYFCPAGGCIAYGVKLVEGELSEPYEPGQSTCPSISHLAPGNVNFLADLTTGVILERDPRVGKKDAKPGKEAFPHYALKNGDEAKMCPNPGSATQPPWGPLPNTAPERQSFQVNFDPMLKVEIYDPEAWASQPDMFLAAPGNLIVPALKKGATYRLTVSGPNKTCSTTFVPDGTRDKPHFKGPSNDECMPAQGGGMIGAHL
jgi:hypothetical protein